MLGYNFGHRKTGSYSPRNEDDDYHASKLEGRGRCDACDSDGPGGTVGVPYTETLRCQTQCNKRLIPIKKFARLALFLLARQLHTIPIQYVLTV